MGQPKLLVANRGEIAVRILRTAKKLQIPTVAIYTLIDADTPHVQLADEAYQINDGTDPKGYLDIDAIVKIAKESGSTMIAPGYGFLSENAKFVEAVEAAGITFLGPTPYQMTSMGLKHEAREVAIKAGIPVTPGSGGVIEELEEAVEIAKKIGYPVMLKASAGGGGMGMSICKNEADLTQNFQATRDKASALFKDSSVFLEKYISRARHVEIQIFGNGKGHCIHFGERECSVQRRHQKVIEESPCPLFQSERGQKARERMCDAAVKLGQVMKYRSAGTVEFVLDDESENYDFFFLELNARIQVEHAVTEVVRPGLDLVELLIRQGLSPDHSLPESELSQEKHAPFKGHSIEARVYCENPKQDFRPAPGRLQLVEWADIGERGRIDTWAKTGTLVTPSYDPMIAKLVVWGKDRAAAVAKLDEVLRDSKILGPITNIDYCRKIIATEAFQAGRVTTTFLNTLTYAPPMIEIITPGLSTTIQDLPGRFVSQGIPRGGAADMNALEIANRLVGNDPGTEGLEMTMIGAKVLFHSPTVIAITGCDVDVKIDKKPVEMWRAIKVEAGSSVAVGTAKETGIRSYMAILGGFPNVAKYMGSKSTFAPASLGGYQGRALFAGDMLNIEPFDGAFTPRSWAPEHRPVMGHTWEVEVTASTQWDPVYVKGMQAMLEAEYTATASSNRAGLRLDGPLVDWARDDGGEGGGHPSNIQDQGYPFGALNLNGDTPVLFGTDGPDMGGFANLLCVARASMWKLGQMRPNDKVKFVLVSPEACYDFGKRQKEWLEDPTSSKWTPSSASEHRTDLSITTSTLWEEGDTRISLTGDEALLIEIGTMKLDMAVRLKLELWDQELRRQKLPGLLYLMTCARSSMIQFDPALIDIDTLKNHMVKALSGLGDVRDFKLPIRIHRFPLVPNDPWTRQAIEFYMKTERDEAIYLPNNYEYVAKNNGLDDALMRKSLFGQRWYVVSKGFFVMLPSLIPMDPRLGLVAQKYNPSRTRTPEGSLGLAGTIGAIYPIESPGGYQLLGRTISSWRAWGNEHCILDNLDQIEFYEVSEEEFEHIDRFCKAGRWAPEVRKSEFNMREYLQWVDGLQDEIKIAQERQAKASAASAEEEAKIFARWTKNKAAKQAAKKESGQVDEGQTGLPVTAPLAASVWKYYVKVGDVIQDDEQRIVELEAMKTSVWITPGDDTVGKKVSSIKVKEGDSVQAGQVLLYLD